MGAWEAEFKATPSPPACWLLGPGAPSPRPAACGRGDTGLVPSPKAGPGPAPFRRRGIGWCLSLRHGDDTRVE